MWLPLSAVAIYRVVTQIGTVFVLVVTAFEFPVSTAISATHLSGDIQRLRHIIRSPRLMMVAVTAIPVAGGFVFAEPNLESFFGMGNEVASWCLRVILIVWECVVSGQRWSGRD